jgi:DNA-binding CsgD family transcriptional regulator
MKKILLIAFLFVLAFASCNKSTVPSPQEDVLYQVEGYFGQKPDSVLQILDTLNLDMLSEKEWAHYCLLRVCVYDALFKYDKETDSLLQVAENYFVGGKDKYFEARTCEALSRIAFKMGKGEQYKLDWLQKAVESVDQCKHVDERFIRFCPKPTTEQDWLETYKYRLHWRLGMTYLDADYIEEGFHHLKIAESYFAEKQKHAMHSLAAFMLGNAYLTKTEYDSCQLYYRIGLEAAEKADDKDLCIYYHFSMSMFYEHLFRNQQFETEEDGQRLLRQSITECQQGLAMYEEQMFRYKDGFYSQLGNAYYNLKQFDSCVYFSEKQIDFLTERHFQIVPNDENSLLYYRLYKSFEALGDYEKALQYANLYVEMQKALKDEPKAVEKVKNEYEKNLEMMRLQADQQAKRLRLYMLLALTLTALTIALWLAYHYHNEKEIEALKFQGIIQRLQSELEQQSQHSLQAMQQRAMELYQSDKADAAANILAEFERCYPQTLERLKATYPELNEAECKVAVFSLLGFRVKEVAHLLNLSANTVTKYRTNIRKKSGLGAFSDFIA